MNAELVRSCTQCKRVNDKLIMRNMFVILTVMCAGLEKGLLERGVPTLFSKGSLKFPLNTLNGNLQPRWGSPVP